MSEYFNDQELGKRYIQTGVDLLSHENHFLLKIVMNIYIYIYIYVYDQVLNFFIIFINYKFRLVNNYNKDICSKWTRYPERFAICIRQFF